MKIELVNKTFKVLVFDLNGTITGRVSEHKSHIDFRNNYIENKLGKVLDVELPNSTTLALQVCGLSPSEYYIFRNSLIDWSLFHKHSEKVNHGLQKLKKRGYKLVLYSDCYGEQIKSTMELLKIGGLFDLIISEEYKMNKPSPKAFRFIASHFQCAPSDLLMVGNDYAKDLLPLIILGGNAIQLDGEHELTDFIKFISSVKEE